jgi:hypothetical protein
VARIARSCAAPLHDAIDGRYGGRMERQDPAIACDLDALTPAERARRAELAASVSAGFREIRETGDGFAARLDAGPETCRAALEWLLLERRCCPFLDLELRLDSSEGPLWLRLGGRPGVKAFLAAAGFGGAPRPPSRCGC